VSLFLAFLFWFIDLRSVESPTAAVTKRLYSNLGVDLAPATTHTLTIAADALVPSPLLPALDGCRGSSSGCCACLRRLPRSSRRRRLRTGRLAFTNRTATIDASSEGCLGVSLPSPRLRDLHHRSVFAVIATDFTDNDATGSVLCVVVQDLVRTAPSSV
jgi:hypothetical protein